MLENDFHLKSTSKATLVSITTSKLSEHATKDDTERSIGELKELLRTLDIEYGSTHIQNKSQIDPATVLGSGKLLEITEVAKSEGSEMLVFDFELSASQIRNIKKLSGLTIIDRVHVILEIFALHAQTKEAKIQIEIARLQYLLPRLSGFWTHLSRQKGGVGIRGGEGEQQIELDRRIIRGRISKLKQELVNVEKSRKEQRKKRKDKAITAALVGYTNAGKSSLLNRLCRENILEEDKLFATLDSTFRMLTPDTKPPLILIDTVGFISNLPNTLIDGFKTTLDSALEADLLLIVCDVSDPHFEKHLQVTQDVLTELGIEKKDQVIIFNKCDLFEDKIKLKIIKRKHPKSFLVSSFNKDDMENLRTYVIDYFLDQQPHFDLFVPYTEGNVHSKLTSKTNVITTHNHENGIYYRVKVPDFIFNTLSVEKFKLSPEQLQEYQPDQNIPDLK